MVENVKEKFAVRKQATKKFDVERFYVRVLNKMEVKKQYQFENSNRFAALENLTDSKDINRAWGNIEENIKTSAKDSLGLQELKQHKPWFDEECLGFFRSKEAG